MKSGYLLFWSSWLIVLLPGLLFVGGALWRIGSVLKSVKRKL